MGTESKYGLMEQNTLATGKTTERVATAYLSMLTKMNTKESGRTTKQTAEVSIVIRTELPMTDSGKMIFKTEKELKDGLMDQSTKAITAKAKSMVMVSTNGMTVQATKDSGLRTKFKG